MKDDERKGVFSKFHSLSLQERLEAIRVLQFNIQERLEVSVNEVDFDIVYRRCVDLVKALERNRSKSDGKE